MKRAQNANMVFVNFLSCKLVSTQVRDNELVHSACLCHYCNYRALLGIWISAVLSLPVQPTFSLHFCYLRDQPCLGDTPSESMHQ